MTRLVPLAAAALFLAPAVASAHFPFLSVTNEDGKDRLRLVFGEDASADDPKYLSILERAEVVRRRPDGRADPVKLTPDGGALTADLSAAPAGTVYTLSLTYGVADKGDGPFLLEYSAAALKERRPGDTGRPAAVNDQPLAIVPEPGGVLKVLAAGTPVAGATVTAGGDLGSEEFTTDDRGVVTLTAEQIADAGVMSVRTSVTLPGAGVYDDKPFPETRRYATAVFTAGDFEQAAEPAEETPASNKIVVAEVAGADLPEGVTSLGAAASGGYLYYYGGHPGTAHKYSTDEQSGNFRRLDLSDPAAGWEDLPGGPKLQGLALVAHPAGGVVRVGGFTARNSLEEEHDLHSVPTVSHYDPEQGEWTDLTPLPGGRSSFDARVLGDKIYVFGGWMMAGAEGEAWHGTGYTADLTADELEWEVLPMPHPRRALSVAAVPETNELYLIGGMPPSGEPTRRVDIFNAKTGTFARGPDLPGETMDGFGSAAFAANGAVYVTTLTGKVLRLKSGADAWEPLGELEKARFFHQLVPAGDGAAFYLIGGGSMEDGRFTTVEKLTVEG